MNILDIILLLCLVPAVIQGLKKGFIAQVVAIVALILGGWIAYKFSDALVGLIGRWIDAPPGAAMQIISFIVIFVLVVIGLWLLGKLLEAAIKIILLGWLNKLLGLIFAIAKYMLIIGLIIVLFDMINDTFNLVSKEYLNSSVLYSGIQKVTYAVFPYLKSLIG